MSVKKLSNITPSLDEKLQGIVSERKGISLQ